MTDGGALVPYGWNAHVEALLADRLDALDARARRGRDPDDVSRRDPDRGEGGDCRGHAGRG